MSAKIIKILTKDLEKTFRKICDEIDKVEMKSPIDKLTLMMGTGLSMISLTCQFFVNITHEYMTALNSEIEKMESEKV